MKCNHYPLPELLAPAGSFTHLKAAVQAGADGIYIGGRRFGARAYAENASTEEMVEALRYAHFYNRNVYLTVNTLMKEEEVNGELERFLAPFYRAGLDGVIVQDLGAALRIHEAFPHLDIHGSTQMTITDPHGARAAARMGMTRVVPARELSLEEIRAIKETGLEVEVFIHGALCYCYSGQCLMSSNYGGRSGNRGACAQPCRLPYGLSCPSRNGDREGGNQDPDSGKMYRGHLLSPKDLCALPLLPDLVNIGVDSLKIEGRMKNVEYVAGVTAIYRKYLDLLADCQGDSNVWKVDPADMKELAELYHREGFTTGYLKCHNGPEMMAIHQPKNTGRQIGKVESIRKNRVSISLEPGHDLAPKDVLVIPIDKKVDGSNGKDKPAGGEEIVLTVPDSVKEEIRNKGSKKAKSIVTLNAPKSGRIRPGMEVYRRYHDPLIRKLRELYVDREIKLPVEADFYAAPNKPSILTLTCQGKEITVPGQEGQIPKARALAQEDVRRQLAKTGTVPFDLESARIRLEGDLFLPMSAIKDMRQRAYSNLKNVLETRYDRGDRFDDNMLAKIPEDVSDSSFTEAQKATSQEMKNFRKAEAWANPERVLNIYTEELLRYIIDQNFADRISLSQDFFTDRELETMADLCHDKGIKVRLSLSRVFRQSVDRARDLVLSGLFDEVEVHNINEGQFIHELSLDISAVAGMSFYQWNREAVHAVDALFPEIQSRILPEELSGPGLCDLAGGSEQKTEWLVYGRFPLMVSAQCLKKTTGRCDHRKEVLYLDRGRDVKMPVSTHCDSCFNIIWRDKPVNRIGELSTVPQADRHIFDLFGTSVSEWENVLARYRRAITL